ncbi:MAG: hypothetical protein ACT4OU_03190 [Hyphomicrobium sp.]
MHSWVYRVLLGLCIVASLAAARHAANMQERHGKADFRNAVRLAASQKSELIKEMKWGFAGRIDGCYRPLLVAPVSLSLYDTTLTAKLMPADYEIRYVYVGAEQKSSRGFSLYAEWIRQTALALADATPYVPVKEALMVGRPPECASAAAIDWRDIWRPDRGLMR